ncbi:dockerin type I domain-containing protein [Stieleria varia]|nr:dockerin type I domain-containing protein [Stieleria varia]
MLAGEVFTTLDVNRSGSPTALDALLIINSLPGTEYSEHLDVNRSGNVSALDALLVINQLGRGPLEIPEIELDGPELTNAIAIGFDYSGIDELPEITSTEMRIRVGEQLTTFQTGTTTHTVVDAPFTGDYQADLRLKSVFNFYYVYSGIAAGTIDRTPPTVSVDLAQLPNGTGLVHTPILYAPIEVIDNVDSPRTEYGVFRLETGSNNIQYHAFDAAGNETVFAMDITSTAEPQSEMVKQQVARNWSVFRTGAGVAGHTALPIDSIDAAGNIADALVSPAPIGFAFSADVQLISGFIQTTESERVESVARVGKLLESITNLQGANRLLVWQHFDPMTGSLNPQRSTADVFDNGVLLSNLVSGIGLMEASGFSNTPEGILLHQTANEILAKVRQGMANLVDSESSDKRLHHSIDENTGVRSTGVLDNFGDEARAAVVDLFVNGLIDSDSLPELRTRKYITQEGREIDVLGSGEGGAFQAFWSSQTFDDVDTAIGPLLTNTLIAHLDSAQLNGRQGFASASAIYDEMGYEYRGNIGVAGLSTNGNPLHGGIGSLYAVPSAMQFLPSAVQSFIGTVLTNNPGLQGPYGLFDAIDNGNIAPYHVGVDVLSYVTGLTGGNVVGGREYYKTRNHDQAIRDLYNSIVPSVNSAPAQWPQPTLDGALDGIDMLSASYAPGEFHDGGNLTIDSDALIRFEAGSEFGGWFGGRIDRVERAVNPTFLLRFRLANFNAGDSTARSVGIKLENEGQAISRTQVPVLSDNWVTVEIPLDNDVNVVIFEALPAGAVLEISQAVFLETALS